MSQELVLGLTVEGGRRAFTVDPAGLLHHTAVIGQSGTGKSFFMARLLEEAIIKTHARIVILDPNGDFGGFYSEQNDEFWTKGDLSQQLKDLHNLSSKITSSFDQKDEFRDVWKSRKFQFVGPTKKFEFYRDDAKAAPLRIHWKRVPFELQDYLLNVDPIAFPKIYQGIASCYHYVNENIEEFPQRVSLEDLEAIAQDFELNKIHVTHGKFDDAISLTSEDWLSIRMQFRKVRKRYSRLFYKGKLRNLTKQETIPIDLGRYIELGFQEDARWQTCIVGMPSQTKDEMLLTAYVSLSSIWRQAVFAWKAAQDKYWSSILVGGEIDREFNSLETSEEPSPDTEDRILEDDEAVVPTDLRLPTIIVIDEAQNFAPDIPHSPLQEKVSDLIATIAAEGRKYGLWIVVATQRPRKLRNGLLAECENGALLRVQSKVEQAAINDAMTAPNDLVNERIGSLKMGQALLFGRWANAPTFIDFGPARTVLGGASIDSKVWVRSV